MKRLAILAALLLPGVVLAHNWGVTVLGSPDPAGKCNPCVTSEVINIARNSLYGWHGCAGFGDLNRVCNAIPNGMHVHAEVAKYDPLEGNFYDGVYHVLFKMVKDPNGVFGDVLVFQGMHHSHFTLYSWPPHWPDDKNDPINPFD